MLIDDRVNQIVKEEVANLISDMKRRLGKNDSALSKSIKSKESNGSIDIIMNEYGNFIDKGVTGNNAGDFKGKRREVHKSTAGYKFGSGRFKGKREDWKKKIDAWMYSRGIQGRDKKGKFIKRASTNFLIRRSIFQHGIKGTLFASKAFEGFQQELKERLSNIDFKDILNNK